MGNDNTKNIKPNENGEKRLQDPKTGRFVEGNPGGGRPKGSVSVVEALKRKLEEVPEGQTKTYLELLVSRYMKNAIQDGDTQLIRDLINRVDGMPTQRQELTGKDGERLEPVLVKFLDGKDNNNTTGV